jgi:hypothetical protein
MRLALIAACVAAQPVADTLAQQPAGGGITPFFSVTPLYQSDASLAGGGSVSVAGVVSRLGFLAPVSPSMRAGLTLNYDYLDYRFDTPTAFGAAPPWGATQRAGVSIPLLFRTSERWSWQVTPSVDYFAETGADWSDAISYGAIAAASRELSNGRIGVGVGVFQQPKNTLAFPFIAVDWRFAERWRLTNPLVAGPTGPAGLELKYALSSHWELGAGGAWRSYRFRLDDRGVAPNGIAEERGIVGFLHLTRGFGRTASLDLYLGGVFGGELRLEDKDGKALVKRDFDPAPLIGATFSARF